MTNPWKIIKYFLLFILVSLSSCKKTSSSAASSTPEDVVLVSALLAKAADVIERKTLLQPCGSGSQMMYEVKMLSLSFVCTKPLELKEAKALLIDVAETFVSMINQETKLIPYLYNYPFEVKNVEVTIFIQNPNSSDDAEGKLCLISTEQGFCRYHIRDPKSKHLVLLERETFEKAKQDLKM